MALYSYIEPVSCIVNGLMKLKLGKIIFWRRFINSLIYNRHFLEVFGNNYFSFKV